jgi:mycofactocin precursor
MSDDPTAVIDQPDQLARATEATEATDAEPVTVDDVLVEEVSIDGMCGVY